MFFLCRDTRPWSWLGRNTENGPNRRTRLDPRNSNTKRQQASIALGFDAAGGHTVRHDTIDDAIRKRHTQHDTWSAHSR